MYYGAMNFPIMDILEELSEVARMGFDYLELAMDPPQAHYTTIRKHKEGISEALKIRALGLVCHLPSFVYTADLTESIRRASLREVIHSLEIASELGASKVVMHPSHLGGLAPFVLDRAMKYAYESLEVIIEKVKQLGLCLCLENMFPKYRWFFEPEDFGDLFKTFPEIKLTLDIGHAHIGSRNSDRILNFLRQFTTRLGHIHLSDNRGKKDDHYPMGEGVIDFKRVIKVLKDNGYNETVTFEIFSEDRGRLQKSREIFLEMLACA